MEWVTEDLLVFGRQKLGSSGRDIVKSTDIQERLEDFQKSQFWVKYIPKKEEYRVHFVNGKIIDCQQKLLKKQDMEGNPIDTSNTDFTIRNLANGFIFARSDVKLPECVQKQAEQLINITSLDFGAIDIIYNKKQDMAYILEVNTAPGLVNSTVESYSKAFMEVYQERKASRKAS